jgi:hypothetical protein
MSRTARVQSIEALEQFRAALSIFTEQAGQSLATVRADAERFLNWLGHDRLKYWQHQIRVRDEQLAEAKSDLHRCLAATIDPHRTPSCHQEKKLVALAKRRLEEAEEKLAAVKRRASLVEEAILDFHAHAEPLAGALLSDLPQAVAHMDRLIARLIEYAQLAPPELKTAVAPRETNRHEQPSMAAGQPADVPAVPSVATPATAAPSPAAAVDESQEAQP